MLGRPSRCSVRPKDRPLLRLGPYARRARYSPSVSTTPDSTATPWDLGRSVGARAAASRSADIGKHWAAFSQNLALPIALQLPPFIAFGHLLTPTPSEVRRCIAVCGQALRTIESDARAMLGWASRQDESRRDEDHARADQGRGRIRSDLVVAGITGGTIAERPSKTAALISKLVL